MSDMKRRDGRMPLHDGCELPCWQLMVGKAPFGLQDPSTAEPSIHAGDVIPWPTTSRGSKTGFS